MATVQDLITAEAQRQGVDPALALAVARKESGFNQQARGSSGEVGVFQLMPGTATEVGVDPYNLAANIRGGVAYLRRMLSNYSDTELALQAYNGGPGNVDRGTVSSRAKDYAHSILAAIGSGQLPAPAPVFSFPGAGATFSLAPAPELVTAAAIVGVIAAAMIIFNPH